MAIPKVAIRSFIRAQNRSERLAAQHEGAAADHCVDAGGWSDAYHSDAFQEIEDAIAAKVAAAYRVSPVDLQLAAQEFYYASIEREMTALGVRI